jgi:hypothetical protein
MAESMTHPDPQAAPPETDLRAMSDEDVVSAFRDAAFLLPTTPGETAERDIDCAQDELLRRLARPDALRETDLTADEIYLDRECLVDIVWADLAHRDVTVADADHVADTLMAAGFHRDRPEVKAAVAAALEDA